MTTGCRFCPNDGTCELQALVDKLGITDIDYPILYHGYEPEHDDPFYDRDYNLCILCGRCVRMCQEVRGSAVLAFTFRGPKAKIAPAFGRNHKEAGCEFCGACVDVCPTGALADKASKWDGKPDGYQVSTCPFCAIGCQIELSHRNRRLSKARANMDPEVNDGQLCVKGRFCQPEVVHHFDRAETPDAHERRVLPGGRLARSPGKGRRGAQGDRARRFRHARLARPHQREPVRGPEIRPGRPGESGDRFHGPAGARRRAGIVVEALLPSHLDQGDRQIGCDPGRRSRQPVRFLRRRDEGPPGARRGRQAGRDRSAREQPGPRRRPLAPAPARHGRGSSSNVLRRSGWPGRSADLAAAARRPPSTIRSSWTRPSKRSPRERT